jgi:hypothetical protein
MIKMFKIPGSKFKISGLVKNPKISSPGGRGFRGRRIRGRLSGFLRFHQP